MKKLMTLAVVIVLGAACEGCSFEAGQSLDAPQESAAAQSSGFSRLSAALPPSEPSSSSVGKSGSRAQRYLSQFNEKNSMMRLIMHFTDQGKAVSKEVTVAAMDGKQLTAMEHEGESVRLLAGAKDVYMVVDRQKVAMALSVVGIDPSAFSTPAYIGDTVTGSGTDTVMGRELPYEKIALPDGASVRYYFDGEELAFITGQTGASSFILEVLEITSDVPKALFDIPGDYQVVNSLQDMMNNPGGFR